MSAIDRALSTLQQEQQDYAKGSLVTPKGESAFHYGQSVGYTQGLERAIAVVLESMKEPEDEQSDSGQTSSFERNLRGR